LFNEQKYIFLREMVSGNVSSWYIKKRKQWKQINKSVFVIFRVNGDYLHDMLNGRDGQC